MLALYVNFDRIIARLFIQAEQSRHIQLLSIATFPPFFAEKGLISVFSVSSVVNFCLTFVITVESNFDAIAPGRFKSGLYACRSLDLGL